MASRELDKRERRILQAVVSEYLENGDAVSSRQVTTRHPLGVSPATVRGVMADLEQLGLLEQKHTSGGRVPTATGLRCFIDTMLRVKGVSAEQASEIRDYLRPSRGAQPSDVVGRASSLLSQLTRHAAVVTMPTLDDQRIAHLEFVPLRGANVLCVVVTTDGRIENRLLTVEPEQLSRLERAQAYLAKLAKGATMAEMRQRLLGELGALKHQYDQVAALQLGEQVSSLFAEPNAHLVVSGQANLLAGALGQDGAPGQSVAHVTSLLAALEDKHSMLDLLDKARTSPQLQVFLGAESAHGAFAEASVVAIPYGVGTQTLGALAVIGPTHMNYGKVISMVDFTADVLTEFLTENEVRTYG